VKHLKINYSAFTIEYIDLKSRLDKVDLTYSKTTSCRHIYTAFIFILLYLLVDIHMAQETKKRVLVGMSWWVDSAVTAHLLIQQWYEVIAWFMKNYADPTNPDCHTRKDRDMALKVSQFLWIKTFIIFDFRKEYDEKIIQYIYDSYKSGLTPNPDILCNTEVKFKLFLEKWIELW